MTSLLRDRKVDVHVLYRSKFGSRMIWAEQESTTGGTEATLRQRRSDAYFIEISERDASNVILEIEFRKIKSYKMRARSWHEVKYDGRLIALHFAENKTFDQFFETLEKVLKLHKKFTQPKNDAAFLQEVQMFQLKQLRPVANFRKERTLSLGTSENENPNSIDSLHSARTQVATSKSLGIPVRERPDRLPDPGIRKLEAGKPKSPNPLSTLQKPKKINLSKDSVVTAIKNRPLPQIPPTSKPPRLPPTSPPPRISGDNQKRLAPKTSITETSDTSDEENAESLSRENSLDYVSGPVYISSDEDSEPLCLNDNPPHRPTKSSNHQNSFDQPSAAQDPIHQTPKKPRRQMHPLLLIQTQGMQCAGCKQTQVTPVLPTKPGQLPKPRCDTKREDSPRSSGWDQTQRSTRPSTNPANPLPKTGSRPLSSTTYGLAMEWQCKACTLCNAFTSLCCAACERIRTDAWGCIDCSVVYSNDVGRCFTCDVWRCQLCSFQNRGAQNDTTLCGACGQR